MRHARIPQQLIVLLSVVLLAACTSTASSAVQSEDVEATVVARVEATLVADAVSVDQKVQVTLTAISLATQTAIALIPTETPTVAPTSTATPLPTATPTPTIEATSTDTPEPAPTATTPSVGYQVFGPANLRSGPGTNYGIAGALQAGDSFSIIARNEDGTWFQIETETGAYAWIAAFLVESAPDPVSVSIAAVIPATPTPAPATVSQATEQTPTPAILGQRLDVSFRNPHYDCDHDQNFAKVRYFQIDLFLSNTTLETVGSPWYPTRWIISNGQSTRESTDVREWCNRFSGCYSQPPVLPGGSEGWTWITGDLALSEWVTAVEWEHNGEVYRQEFENNAINRSEWNYKSCQ